MSLDFGSILSRAWKITWENKILWIFGILAGLGGGGGNPGFNFGGGGDGDGQSGQGPDLPPQFEQFFIRLQEGDPALIALIVGLVCLGLLLAIVLIALSVIGRGGLIGGVQLAQANGRVTFGEAWQVGVRHFWTLFLIGLVVGLVTFAVAVLTILPGALLTALTFGFGVICLVPLICLLVIVSIILNIVAYFAQIAAVIENLSVGDALRRGWEVLRSNIGSIIVLGIILLVIGGVIGFVIALPLIAVVFPPLIGAAAGDESGLITGLGIAAICFLIYLPVLLLLGGILQTWITAAWTLAYNQFTGRAGALGTTAAPPVIPAS
jgi:hypothetical protein